MIKTSANTFCEIIMSPIPGTTKIVPKKEMQKESTRMLPEVEAQGIDVSKGRGGPDVVETVVHEILGHGAVDAIRRKVGWWGSEQLLDVAAKDPFYAKYLIKGREEPFAEMVEGMSAKEYRELMEPYFKSLRDSPGDRIVSQQEHARTDKAIRRAYERSLKSKKTYGD